MLTSGWIGSIFFFKQVMHVAIPSNQGRKEAVSSQVDGANTPKCNSPSEAFTFTAPTTNNENDLWHSGPVIRSTRACITPWYRVTLKPELILRGEAKVRHDQTNEGETRAE